MEALVKVGTVDGEHLEYPDKDDALTASMNNLNGASFHIAYQYAAWCEKHGARTLAPEARRAFDEYLDRRESHAASRHAVLGVFLAHFYSLDREWARSLPGRAASSEKSKIAFWDGYVSNRQMYSHVFEDLWRWYEEFVNVDPAQNPVLARMHEATISHVMSAYFYDLANADGIVEKFLEKGDPRAVERCVQQTVFLLAGKRGDPAFNKSKLAGLWKHRSFRSHNLDMWFRATPLDDESAITAYRDHITQYPGKINGGCNPVYKLGEYAENFPLEVAECLLACVPKHVGGIVPDKVREILEALLKSKDPRVKLLCVEIIEKAERMGLYCRDLLPGRQTAA